ncbi:hypothetical protein C4552_02865 [Candidatus Parcubacteria bacterium]|nr:MAG: hypothetical protein C4552_02865 [Candidatus Parcubacteria bacterium]
MTSFHVLISRNIISSPLLDALLADGATRVVLLVPVEKQLFFLSEFLRPGLIIHPVAFASTRFEAALRYLALAATDTHSLAIKRKTELGGRGALLVRLIGNRRWAQALIRQVSRWLAPREPFGAIVRAYRPDAVFATDVQQDADARLIEAARDAGVPTIGMVRSWDNLTAKGLVRTIPDTLVVNNELVAEEAARYHGIPRGALQVIGIPHYDRYGGAPPHARADFAARLGLRPDERFVLYAPTGDRYLGQNDLDGFVIRLLADALPAGWRIVVRLPPSDSMRIAADLPPAALVHRPGRQLGTGKGFKHNELTLEDDEVLRDSLAFAEVVVGGPSTILIDAAVYDTPAIAIAFDPTPNRPYYESIRRYYDYDHFASLRAAGGIRFAESPEELRKWIGRYCSDPELDRAGRARIVTQEAWRLDGGASARLAKILGARSRLAVMNKNE